MHDRNVRDDRRAEGKRQALVPAMTPLLRVLHLGSKRIDGMLIEPGSVGAYRRAKAEHRSILLARREDGSYEVAGDVRE